MIGLEIEELLRRDRTHEELEDVIVSAPLTTAILPDEVDAVPAAELRQVRAVEGRAIVNHVVRDADGGAVAAVEGSNGLGEVIPAFFNVDEDGGQDCYFVFQIGIRTGYEPGRSSKPTFSI